VTGEVILLRRALGDVRVTAARAIVARFARGPDRELDPEVGVRDMAGDGDEKGKWFGTSANDIFV
jgi:hypothetical protein